MFPLGSSSFRGPTRGHASPPQVRPRRPAFVGGTGGSSGGFQKQHPQQLQQQQQWRHQMAAVSPTYYAPELARSSSSVSRGPSIQLLDASGKRGAVARYPTAGEVLPHHGSSVYVPTFHPRPQPPVVSPRCVAPAGAAPYAAMSSFAVGARFAAAPRGGVVVLPLKNLAGDTALQKVYTRGVSGTDQAVQHKYVSPHVSQQQQPPWQRVLYSASPPVYPRQQQQQQQKQQIQPAPAVALQELQGRSTGPQMVGSRQRQLQHQHSLPILSGAGGAALPRLIKSALRSYASSQSAGTKSSSSVKTGASVQFALNEDEVFVENGAAFEKVAEGRAKLPKRAAAPYPAASQTVAPQGTVQRQPGPATATPETAAVAATTAAATAADTPAAAAAAPPSPVATRATTIAEPAAADAAILAAQAVRRAGGQEETRVELPRLKSKEQTSAAKAPAKTEATAAPAGPGGEAVEEEEALAARKGRAHSPATVTVAATPTPAAKVVLSPTGETIQKEVPSREQRAATLDSRTQSMKAEISRENYGQVDSGGVSSKRGDSVSKIVAERNPQDSQKEPCIQTHNSPAGEAGKQSSADVEQGGIRLGKVTAQQQLSQQNTEKQISRQKQQLEKTQPENTQAQRQLEPRLQSGADEQKCSMAQQEQKDWLEEGKRQQAVANVMIKGGEASQTAPGCRPRVWVGSKNPPHVCVNFSATFQPKVLVRRSSAPALHIYGEEQVPVKDYFAFKTASRTAVGGKRTAAAPAPAPAPFAVEQAILTAVATANSKAQSAVAVPSIKKAHFSLQTEKTDTIVEQQEAGKAEVVAETEERCASTTGEATVDKAETRGAGEAEKETAGGRSAETSATVYAGAALKPKTAGTDAGESALVMCGDAGARRDPPSFVAGGIGDAAPLPEEAAPYGMSRNDWQILSSFFSSSPSTPRSSSVVLRLGSLPFEVSEKEQRTARRNSINSTADELSADEEDWRWEMAQPTILFHRPHQETKRQTRQGTTKAGDFTATGAGTAAKHDRLLIVVDTTTEWWPSVQVRWIDAENKTVQEPQQQHQPQKQQVSQQHGAEQVGKNSSVVGDDGQTQEIENRFLMERGLPTNQPGICIWSNNKPTLLDRRV